MKTYPAAVETMLASGHIRFAYLIKLSFDTPMYLSGVGFDILYNSNNYISSPTFNGMDEFTKQAEMNVTEIQMSFSLAEQVIIAIVLGQDYYNKAVTIERVFLDDNNQVIHGELVWKGKVTSYSDDQSKGVVNLTVSSFWAEFDASNSWRTTINSHIKRFAGDLCFKYAAKASETVYWGGKVNTPSAGAVSRGDGGSTTGSIKRIH